MPMNKREQELVLAAMNGNTNSFEELYTLYYEKIYALALTMTKNSADAEDVLQATFISAWKNLAALENPAAFNTWLQRITVNRCNSLLRRRRYDLSTDDEGEDGEVMQLESDLMLPEQYAERDDLSHRLQKMISELSDVQRETVTLYYYNEMTVEEIAEIMGCAEGTVKSRLYLARRALKTEIEEQERKTGERFYGVALLPFGTIFVKQVNGTMISKSAAMHVFQRIASTVFGVPPVMPQSAPPASVPASSPVGHAAAGVARHGARYAAAGAAKLSVPLWAKITIGVLAVVLAAAGGVVAWGVFRSPAGETTDAASATAAVDQAATQQASEIPTQAPTEAPTITDVNSTDVSSGRDDGYDYPYPKNIRATKDNNTGGVRITWDPVDGADYYSVYYHTDNSTEWQQVINCGLKDCYHYHYDCVDGVTYTYTVRACKNGQGNVSSYDPVGASITYHTSTPGLWSELYRGFVMNKEYLNSNSYVDDESTITFFIYDMNGDNIPELIADSGLNAPRGMNREYVYTVSNNEVVYCGEIDSFGVYTYNPFSDNKGLFFGEGRMGTEYVYYSLLENNVIETKAVVSFTSKNNVNFENGYTTDCMDDSLYQTYLDCTAQYFGEEPNRGYKYSFDKTKIFSVKVIQSQGWDWFINMYPFD